MRIAVLADIHGNMPAFEAALDHVRRQRVDQLVIAGDVVIGSPDSAACWRLAQSLGCPILRGNHERYAARYGTPAADPAWGSEQFAPIRWAARQLSDQDCQAIDRLPLALRLPEAPDLLFVHASLRDDHDSVFAYTPDEQLAAMFEGADERTIVRAHNHAAQVRLWAGRAIVTTGSIGLALDGSPTAQYLILERRASTSGEAPHWHLEHQSIPYDVDATLRRFHETGYLEATGPMGRLYMREVATASFQIVPFLRAYRRWAASDGLTLDQAFARFRETF